MRLTTTVLATLLHPYQQFNSLIRNPQQSNQRNKPRQFHRLRELQALPSNGTKQTHAALVGNLVEEVGYPLLQQMEMQMQLRTPYRQTCPRNPHNALTTRA